MNDLSANQKAEFVKHVEESQMKESLKMYNRLVENCFDKCVMTDWNGGFSTKQLSEPEGKCLDNCAAKFLKLTQRAGFRYGEYQAQHAPNGGQN
mmetsp:Transcript_49480/g.86484  ORF Transcript_49480/g.86484 Transcript_49480/m.86484 type:complete len:94 (+) Transcript_49480:92-373(+)|eukprot:CAMPEP_0184967914 /NCGR_PEP_ID=MMETSP1098-20130426/1130_1 /TAXON_ID=89044 /ORGANISM="Spumella elongata, Strain CCAP 955/1" /LENGTH=93 /DNA_ID=CAMNT_0027489437 /DNA_START=91 /DNA_END=372 /DNA_ORIENTATION=-